jgi:hypothetical protein
MSFYPHLPERFLASGELDVRATREELPAVPPSLLECTLIELATHLARTAGL